MNDIVSFFSEIFSYGFMVRAFGAGIISALVLSFIGIFVSLKKMAFFGEGIAHASLCGIALALLFGFAPTPFAVIFAVLIGSLVYFLEQKLPLSGDTVIAVVFVSFMSLGSLILSLRSGYQPDLVSFLFGNILAVKSFDLLFQVALAIPLWISLIALRDKLVLISIDPELAASEGLPVKGLSFFLYVATAVSVVLGIKVLGVVLVSAMLVIPIAAGKTVAKSLFSLTVFSALFSLLSVASGLIVSYSFGFPAGSSIVIVSALIFIITAVIGYIISKQHSDKKVGKNNDK